MNALADIRQRLELTNEALAKLGQKIKESPESPGLLLNIETLNKARLHLMQQFNEAAQAQGVEVCTYRLFPEGTERYSITGIGKAFVNFQAMFSIAYEAVKKSRPIKSLQAIDMADETLLDFAYSFPGSVGIAFTIPSQVSLYGNYFDLTVEQLFKMAQSNNSQELRSFSRKLGVGPVRAMYRWADDLVRAGFGVDVQWKGTGAQSTRLYIQKSELSSLTAAILATSEEIHSQLTLDGILQGVDIPTKAFHFEYRDTRNRKRDIRGKFIDAIKAGHPVKVPQRYSAIIRKTTRTNFSMEEDTTEYILLQLDELGNPAPPHKPL